MSEDPQAAESAGCDECAITRTQARMLVHDLKAPLTAISGYAELLARHDLDPEHEKTAFDAIRDAVLRMDAMLDDAFSSRRSAQTLVAPLLPLVESAIADARVGTTRVLRLEPAEEVGAAVDPMLMRRALDNLIGNALKYSPAPEVVDVSVVSSDAGELLGGAAAVIEVADRGPGIPEAERERVFVPFERLMRAGDPPGQGLGLAVVAGVVEEAGGAIEARSRVGGGTVMHLELPLAR